MPQLEHIKSLFTESIQTQISAVESISEPIDQTVELLVSSLLNGQRLFVTGTESANSIAAHFANLMNTGMKFERPAFPVVALGPYRQQQVASLGQTDDVLLVFSSNQGDDNALVASMEAALSREMIIVAITGQSNDTVSGLLGADDIELQIPSLNPARILEQQLLLSHCLVELIEATIFPQEPE